MDRLPVELFVEVLSYAAVALPSDSMDEIVRVWKWRTVAAAVSKSWRAVLYGCPTLWSTIWVYRFTPAAFLAHNLEQAAAVDVTLVVDLQPKYSIRLQSGVRRVVCARPAPFLQMLDSVLRPRFAQVARLRVFAANGEEWKGFEERLSTYATPRLRMLHVCCARPHYAGTPHPGVLAWASRLEEVAAAGLWFRQPAETFSFLTSLEIGWIWDPASFPWSTFCDVLNSAQHLVQLRLRDVECIDVDPLRLATLPSLQRLWISVDGDLCGLVLAQLRAPRLHFLDLGVSGEASLATIMRSVDHLLRSATEVTGSFLLPLDNGFDLFIAALRSVRTLDLRRIGGISGFREESDYDHGGRVLPNLLRIFSSGSSVLPHLVVLKVDESAAWSEVNALFDASQFRTLDSVVCNRDGKRWRLSEGQAVAENFEEKGWWPMGGVFIT